MIETRDTCRQIKMTEMYQPLLEADGPQHAHVCSVSPNVTQFNKHLIITRQIRPVLKIVSLRN